MCKILSKSTIIDIVTEQNFEVMSNNFSVCTCKISSSKKNGDYGDNDIIIIIIDGGGGGNHYHHHHL